MAESSLLCVIIAGQDTHPLRVQQGKRMQIKQDKL